MTEPQPITVPADLRIDALEAAVAQAAVEIVTLRAVILTLEGQLDEARQRMAWFQDRMGEGEPAAELDEDDAAVT